MRSSLSKNKSKKLRILVIGGDGMLGHQLLRQLGNRHCVRVVLHKAARQYRGMGLYSPVNAYFGVDVRYFGRVEKIVRSFRPDAVINAVGIIKQRDDGEDPVLNVAVNSLFPHQMARLCGEIGARFVHLSTDCVFNGSRGNYSETDEPDAGDLYGRSKLLGEVGYAPAITLRTSMIGPELFRKAGLLEWFMAQQGSVSGYTRAVFSGFTTIELARVVERAIVRRPDLHGVYHASAEPITKYDLLQLIKRKLGHDIRIVRDGSLRIDRSLDSTRFRRDFSYAPPSWDYMIHELADQIKGDAR